MILYRYNDEYLTREQLLNAQAGQHQAERRHVLKPEIAQVRQKQNPMPHPASRNPFPSPLSVMQAHPRGFLFDLDGTLLDTLPDLVVVVNTVLADHHFPTRTRDEILSYVGNGAQTLMRQAVPDRSSEEVIAQAFAEFKGYYSELGIALTQPYPNILDVLATLKTQGKILGILSNKFEQGIKDVEARFFPGVFHAAHGEREDEGIPRKPHPLGLTMLAEELHLQPANCLYFGDSAGDIITAHAAGMTSVGCTWGYRPATELKDAGAQILIDSPKEILALA